MLYHKYRGNNSDIFYYYPFFFFPDIRFRNFLGGDDRGGVGCSLHHYERRHDVTVMCPGLRGVCVFGMMWASAMRGNRGGVCVVWCGAGGMLLEVSI